jgi:hypothetical protein
MTVPSQERNVGLEAVVATFADDILGVELSPGLVRVALGEIRSDHRAQPVVRNSIPVVHLVLPNETARHLAEVLAVAVQEMNTITQAGMRIAFVSPTVSPTVSPKLPQRREHANS